MAFEGTGSLAIQIWSNAAQNERRARGWHPAMLAAMIQSNMWRTSTDWPQRQAFNVAMWMLAMEEFGVE